MQNLMWSSVFARLWLDKAQIIVSDFSRRRSLGGSETLDEPSCPIIVRPFILQRKTLIQPNVVPMKVNGKIKESIFINFKVIYS